MKSPLPVQTCYTEVLGSENVSLIKIRKNRAYVAGTMLTRTSVGFSLLRKNAAALSHSFGP
jgi:hypothetical protein